MLDEKGIQLSEITNKYPRSFQTLGYDVLMDFDDTYKPKVIGTFELCINSVLLILYTKPGQIPSIPDLGIDIESYLHEYSDDINIPNKIKTMLDDQCNRLQVTGIQIECYIDKTEAGANALVVKITGTDKLSYGTDGNPVIIGITYDKLGKLYTKKRYL